MTPLVTAAEYLSAGALILAALFGFLGVRYGARAQARTQEAQRQLAEAAQKATADNNAGALALELAQGLRAELDTVKRELSDVRDELVHERHWQDDVRDFWRKHDDWDDLVLDKLEQLMPGATADLPARPVLPARKPWRRRPDSSQE